MIFGCCFISRKPIKYQKYGGHNDTGYVKASRREAPGLRPRVIGQASFDRLEKSRRVARGWNPPRMTHELQKGQKPVLTWELLKHAHGGRLIGLALGFVLVVSQWALQKKSPRGNIRSKGYLEILRSLHTQKK